MSPPWKVTRFCVTSLEGDTILCHLPGGVSSSREVLLPGADSSPYSRREAPRTGGICGRLPTLPGFCPTPAPPPAPPPVQPFHHLQRRVAHRVALRGARLSGHLPTTFQAHAPPWRPTCAHVARHMRGGLAPPYILEITGSQMGMVATPPGQSKYKGNKDIAFSKGPAFS